MAFDFAGIPGTPCQSGPLQIRYYVPRMPQGRCVIARYCCRLTSWIPPYESTSHLPSICSQIAAPRKKHPDRPRVHRGPLQSPNLELDPFSFTSFQLLRIYGFNSADCFVTCQQRQPEPTTEFQAHHTNQAYCKSGTTRREAPELICFRLRGNIS